MKAAKGSGILRRSGRRSLAVPPHGLHRPRRHLFPKLPTKDLGNPHKRCAQQEHPGQHERHPRPQTLQLLATLKFPRGGDSDEGPHLPQHPAHRFLLTLGHRRQDLNLAISPSDPRVDQIAIALPVRRPLGGEGRRPRLRHGLVQFLQQLDTSKNRCSPKALMIH